jgi:hypothetical protein
MPGQHSSRRCAAGSPPRHMPVMKVARTAHLQQNSQGRSLFKPSGSEKTVVEYRGTGGLSDRACGRAGWNRRRFRPLSFAKAATIVAPLAGWPDGA